jgi:hypothetical protein
MEIGIVTLAGLKRERAVGPSALFRVAKTFPLRRLRINAESLGKRQCLRNHEKRIGSCNATKIRHEPTNRAHLTVVH